MNREKLISCLKYNNIIKPINDQIILMPEDKTINPILIGVTGSVGKTSMCLLLKEYLVTLGKNVTVLSSATMFLPEYGYIYENDLAQPIHSDEFLHSFINCSLLSNAEYIIIEVSEESLVKNYSLDIPFDIKILTGFLNKWRVIEETDDDYFNNKAKFFKNDDTVYFANSVADRVLEFSNLTTNMYYYGSKFNSNGITASDIYCRLNAFTQGINKQYIEGIIDQVSYKLRAQSLFGEFNAYNILGVLAIIKYLDICDVGILNKALSTVDLPGRKAIEYKGRHIVITRNYLSELNYVADLKSGILTDSLEWGRRALEEDFYFHINNVIVMDGMYGWHANWNNGPEERFRADLEKGKAEYLRIKSNYINTINKVALTLCNPGSADKDYMLNFLAKPYEDNNIEIMGKYKNRIDAIKAVLAVSEPNDLIYISGRGSYSQYMDGDELSFFADENIVNTYLDLIN